jgi:hypothetical protein
MRLAPSEFVTTSSARGRGRKDRDRCATIEASALVHGPCACCHLFCRLRPALRPSTPTRNTATCLIRKSRITTPHTETLIDDSHVSRRWYHALRYGLRPRHPRSRPRLRIRTVRSLTPRPARPSLLSFPASAVAMLPTPRRSTQQCAIARLFSLPVPAPSRAAFRPRHSLLPNLRDLV